MEALGECHVLFDRVHVLPGWSIVFASVVTVASGTFISQFQHTIPVQFEFN